MSNLQEAIEAVNREQQKVYSKHSQREQAIKKIFDMAYGWGRWNMVVDDTAPAFRKAVEELLKI